MEVIVSLDTEDFITPQAADAQAWWADTLAAHGIRGSFQCVAEVLRRHKRRGRRDVLEKIAAHEVGYHTDMHSVPPTHPQALEGKSLAEGVEWVLRHEAGGFAEFLETFGRVPVSYCPPGCSWTPATLLAMGAMGIKVWAGSESFLESGWYCGLLAKSYDLAFERYYVDPEHGEERFHRDFEELCARRRPVIVVMTHPTRLVTTEFWDRVFFGARRPSLEELPPPPLRSDDSVAQAKAMVERLLEWLAGRRDVRFIDFSTFYAERTGPGGSAGGSGVGNGRERGRDLTSLLRETGLAPGEEGLLPLRAADEPAPEGSEGAVPEGPVTDGTFGYSWEVFPEGFTGAALMEQARGLLWSFAPAGGSAE